MPPPYYALGRWVEQGRAAALVGKRRFFTRRETRSFLLELERFELPPNVFREIATVRDLIAPGPDIDDLPRLEASLANIITHGGTR